MTKLIKFILLITIFFNTNIGFSQVGINTVTPVSTLDINGNLSVKVVNLNGGPGGAATPISDGVYISVTPNPGSREFLMPNAASLPGRIYIIRNVNNSVIAEFYSLGGAFFSKSSNTATSPPLVLQANATGKTVILVSDGINWTFFD